MVQAAMFNIRMQETMKHASPHFLRPMALERVLYLPKTASHHVFPSPDAALRRGNVSGHSQRSFESSLGHIFARIKHRGITDDPLSQNKLHRSPPTCRLTSALQSRQLT
jgi:hypothetical protein